MPTVASLSNNPALVRLARLAIAVVLSLACVWAMWLALRIGFANSAFLFRPLAALGILSEDGSISGELAAVNRALRLTPNDPDARAVRGLLLSQYGEYGDAVLELERATELRPRDYYLWLELGMARDQLGDQEGAGRALRESVRLAPYYARPAWQYGNLLFRQGRRDEAFAELRRAARSDSALLPGTIDLAWSASGNAEAVRKALQPQRPFEHLALARFLAKHGEGKEAMAEFLSAGATSREDSRDLVTDLLGQKDFRDAHEIWAREHGNQTAESPEQSSLTYDGGFEKPLEVNDPGFGWQVIQNVPSISLSLDTANSYKGARSLRIAFHGDSNSAAPVISQIVLVDPKTHYRLQLAARTEEVISGGLPVVVVSDVDVTGVTLAESEPFASGTSPWHEWVLDFTTGAQANVILVSVRRKSCPAGPCPIFGSLWLDEFFLRAIPGREVRP